MMVAVRLLLIAFLALMLCGCFVGPLKPEVHRLDAAESDDARLDRVILTKRVVLERGKRKGGFYSGEKTVDVTATSAFGLEHEIANVDCIVAGLSDELEGAHIIAPTEFWKTVGGGRETLELTSLFEEREASGARGDDLDFLVVVYHQRMDVESFFAEMYIEGGFRDLDKEIATAVTIDIKDRRVVDAIELEAYHHLVLAHVLVVIPMARINWPKGNPCQMAGRHAGEAIASSLSTTKAPRIAVVAARTNPYSALSAPASEVTAAAESASTSTIRVLPRYHDISDLPPQEQILVKAEQGDAEAQMQLYWSSEEPSRLTWLCRSADRGLAEAAYRIGHLYHHGQEGLPRDNARAYLWYRLASIGGHSQAKIELEDMLTEISAEQKDEAQRLFHEWKPGQCEFEITPDSPSN